ncbi:Uncharacterised protein [Campylobacter jejuni]|nr:Uncharacterised protein [Campylobacter jejuni]
MVVLTERVFRFSLFISQLLAKAIPVRGARLEKPAQETERAFCFCLTRPGYRIYLPALAFLKVVPVLQTTPASASQAWVAISWPNIF